MFIYPYKTGSASAKVLAEAIGAKLIRHKNSKFLGTEEKTVINWGASTLPDNVTGARVINSPEAVGKASDKLMCLDNLYYGGDVAIPSYTTDYDAAVHWIEGGHTVVCREKLNGHSGEGIVIATEVEQLVNAPLYTKYIPKKSEYRVHVFDGRVIDVRRKARRMDVPDDQINWKVRSYANGFVFAKGEALGEVPRSVTYNAIQAVEALGLVFGAVDVIFNDKQKQAYVLEVNTAPGLEGSTVDSYANAIAEYLAPPEAVLVMQKPRDIPKDWLQANFNNIAFNNDANVVLGDADDYR